MTPPRWIDDLFADIDRRDPDAFVGHLTEDVSFTFGNADTVRGRPAVAAAVGGFFQSIAALQHEIAEAWSLPGVVVVHGTVAYTRHDRSRLTVPFATIMTLEGDLVRDYRIFVDASLLYQVYQAP